MDVKPSLLQRARSLMIYLGACLLLIEGLRALLSWLRSHQWTWTQNSSPLQDASSNAVALLIDAENFASIPIERVVEFALTEAQKLGDVTIRRVYSNCHLFNSVSNSLNDTCLRLDFEQIHLTKPTPNKNAADITLSIDAIALAVAGTCKRFCIVTGDSDFTPLVRRLRMLKCQVLGIGKKQAAKTLVTACHSFVFIDDVTDASPAPRKPAPSRSARTTGESPVENQSPASMQSAQASEGQAETPASPAIAILTRAYQDASHERAGEWVLLSRLGLSLKRLDPEFKAADYAEDLSALIQLHSDVFEFGKKSNGHPQMRLKA